jgi:hypothetical protein
MFFWLKLNTREEGFKSTIPPSHLQIFFPLYSKPFWWIFLKRFHSYSNSLRNFIIKVSNGRDNPLSAKYPNYESTYLPRIFLKYIGNLFILSNPFLSYISLLYCQGESIIYTIHLNYCRFDLARLKYAS